MIIQEACWKIESKRQKFNNPRNAKVKFQFQIKREAEEAKQEVLNELANIKNQNQEIIDERDQLRTDKKQLIDQE